MGGSCAYPVLADLANDKNFHGTVICSVVPRLFVAPPGSPPMDRAEKTVRRSHAQTPAQRASEYLAMPLEEHVAFLKQEELTLDDLLKRLPIPNRPYAQVRPLSDQERQALPLLARGAALRFLLTRLVDWFHVPSGALVRPKDPLEYYRKLRFHQTVKTVRDYGIEE